MQTMNCDGTQDAPTWLFLPGTGLIGVNSKIEPRGQRRARTLAPPMA